MIMSWRSWFIIGAVFGANIGLIFTSMVLSELEEEEGFKKWEEQQKKRRH